MPDRELWTVVHGAVFGTLLLVGFMVGLVELWALGFRALGRDAVGSRSRRLPIATSLMAVAAWLAVISGTWILYPWYRAPPPEGAPDLSAYPRYLLLSDEATAALHTFGMEWKEHVAWTAPFLATSVAFVVLYYGVDLLRRHDMRGPLMTLLGLAFGAVVIAGVLGVLIARAAPIR